MYILILHLKTSAFCLSSWQELNDAEFIPMPTPSPAPVERETPPNFPSPIPKIEEGMESLKLMASPQSPKKSCDLKLYIPSKDVSINMCVY